MKVLFKKYFFLPILLFWSVGSHAASGLVSKEAFVDSAVRVHHSISKDAREIEKASATHGSAAVTHHYAGARNHSFFEIFEESVNNTLKFSSATVVLGYVRHFFRISDFFLPARKLFSDSCLFSVKSLYLVFRVFRL